MRYPHLADAGLAEPGQQRQQLVAGQADAFSWLANTFQVSGAKTSWGPFGCLLSRTVTAGPTMPTSTQAPPLSPLVRHATPVMSIVLRPLS